MVISIELPRQGEDVLRTAFGENLERTALEAMAIEGYRTGKLSRYELQTLLGLEDRWETEAWLGSKGVPLSYDLEDLAADRKTLERVLGQAKS